jgi:hypothetical protein
MQANGMSKMQNGIKDGRFRRTKDLSKNPLASSDDERDYV